jgi:hypothetical protein
MAKLADLGVNNLIQGVPCTLAKNKSLYMSGLNLAAVVDDLSSWVNDDLSHIEAVSVNLRVSERNIDLSGLCSSSDAIHLLRIGTDTVLVVFLEQRKRVLVVDTPLPVRVSRQMSAAICLENSKLQYKRTRGSLSFISCGFFTGAFQVLTCLREGNKLALLLTSFCDERNGLLDGLL